MANHLIGKPAAVEIRTMVTHDPCLGIDECNWDFSSVIGPKTIILVVMSSRRRLFAFALVCICAVSQRCFAGPLRPCTPEARRFSLPNPFPRASSFPQPPTPMFRLYEINLTQIPTPPEFRTHDTKAPNASGVILPNSALASTTSTVPGRANHSVRVDHKLLHGQSRVRENGHYQAISQVRAFPSPFFGVNELNRDFSIINHCFLPALYRDHCLRL